MLQWQSQDAKAKFSELMRLAQESPQVITVRGKEEAVLVSKEYYDSLTRAKPSLVSVLRKSPLVGLDLDIKRDTSMPRDITL